MKRALLFVWWLLLQVLKGLLATGIGLLAGYVLSLWPWLLGILGMLVLLVFAVDWERVYEQFEEWERCRAIRAKDRKEEREHRRSLFQCDATWASRCCVVRHPVNGPRRHRAGAEGGAGGVVKVGRCGGCRA